MKYPLRTEYEGQIIELVLLDPAYSNQRYVGVYAGEDQDFLKLSPYVDLARADTSFGVNAIRRYLENENGNEEIRSVKKERQFGKQHILTLEKVFSLDSENTNVGIVIPKD